MELGEEVGFGCCVSGEGKLVGLEEKGARDVGMDRGVVTYMAIWETSGGGKVNSAALEGIWVSGKEKRRGYDSLINTLLTTFAPTPLKNALPPSSLATLTIPFNAFL